MSEPFELGVNYWPAKKFVRMWSRFDAAEVSEDFRRIAALGLTLVRMFVFWPDFQPAPDLVDERRLDDLARVFDLAARHGLRLMPALLVGHMSGPNWLPAWAMSPAENDRPAAYMVDGGASATKPRDIFSDEEIVGAELRLVRAVVGRFRAHPALWGWDVCNEIDLVQLPRGDGGAHWLERVTAEIRALDPAHPVTAGILQAPDSSPRGFHRADHRFTDVASVHTYPLYDATAAGFGDVAYVARMIEETRAAAGVPVMLTEFGLPTNPEPGTRTVTMTYGGRERRVALVDEGEAGAFVRNVLPVARHAGATGALIWCYSDYDPALYAEPPFDVLVHERYFGIFDANGRLKATGEALRDFARSG